MSPSDELYRLAKGKHKSSQQSTATYSAEPHSLPPRDFAELVWENGQVVMQGEPNRARKPTSKIIRLEDLPQNSRLRDEGLAKGDNIETSLGRLGIMESAMNDFHIPVPSDLGEHDDTVPWLRYQMDEDEHVQHNYSSEFYEELPGVTAHNHLNHTNSVALADRRCDGVRAIKDSHTTRVQNSVLPIRPKVSPSDQLSSHQSICSFPSLGSKVSAIESTQKLLLGDSAQKGYSSSVYPRVKMQTKDPGQQLPSSTIMNFSSHFSKYASLVKSSVDAVSSKAGLEVSVAKQTDGKKIRSVLTGVEPVDPSQVASVSGEQRDKGYHCQLDALSKVDGSKLPMSKPLEMLFSATHSGLVSCQDSKIIDMAPKQAAVPSAEPVVASSVCSGNSADRASNDPTYGLKRKYREYEDSEYRNEDIDEESVGIRKAANNRVGFGPKRGRAAEVHNLSERRRRDRINEKMRALQELIPNCNKVDKASMLDEAIEYLKTLQLQVQMMSMGLGLCMRPMMLPHASQMPRFSPMSVGMGMEYGLGRLDIMNGNPSNYQLVQMPSVPGTRFPMEPAPGLGNLTANPMPNLPMYGFQGQCIGVPAPVMGLNSISSVVPVGDLGLAQTSQAKDRM